jgi:hypothetical protein
MDVFIRKTGLYKHLGNFYNPIFACFKKYKYFYLQNWIIQAFRQFL